ncbi:MAG: hypothetical protein GY749_39770 [Desulfobacteraceae bacterium]|nr:hypothetical protein [Desulfobacteraceae bacterium]
MEMTDSKNLLKQMIDFQKTVFNSSFTTMTMVHTRMGKIMDILMDQVLWSYEKWKSVADDWNEAYQKSTDALKQTADENFTKAETYCVKDK